MYRGRARSCRLSPHPRSSDNRSATVRFPSRSLPTSVTLPSWPLPSAVPSGTGSRPLHAVHRLVLRLLPRLRLAASGVSRPLRGVWSEGTSDRDAEGKRVRGEEDRSRMTDDGGLLRSLKDSSLRYFLRSSVPSVSPRPSLSLHSPLRGREERTTEGVSDERMEEARSVRARFTRSHGSLHASGSTLLSSVFHLQH